MRFRHLHGMRLGVRFQAGAAMNGFGITKRQDEIGQIDFHPISGGEISKGHFESLQLSQFGVGPKHKTYACGACGGTTNGRVLCEVQRKVDLAHVYWCWCSCDKGEPTVLVEKDGMITAQLPIAREFHAGSDWPTNLSSLYDEAAKAYSAGAYTASTMVCRKLLMACACDKGEADGKPFAAYVDHLTTNVLNYPAAKAAIDAIRLIGNEANHEVKIVNQADATRAMKIVTYMLATIYSLPAA